MNKTLTRLHLWIPLAAALLDSAWAYSALKVPEGSNAASSVSMINSTVWIFLHVPATLLSSLFFKSGASVTPQELLSMGALGALQMAAIGWWLGRYFDKKKNA